MGGMDTSQPVQNVWPTPGDLGSPGYWLRYFSPSPDAFVLEDDAVAECRAIWSSGGHYLAPISAPTQSRLGDQTHGVAYGNADAQAFVSAMVAAYYDVGPLLLPSNNKLYCWLDQEYGTILCSEYWNAWAGYIVLTDFDSSGVAPMYACLYCSPLNNSHDHNCSIIDSVHNFGAAGVWTPEPQRCGNTLENPPAWAPATCSSTPTILWQFALQGCGAGRQVDLDLSSLNYHDYCFDLSGSP